jgi:Na+/H+-dicarboxylate symporter
VSLGLRPMRCPMHPSVDQLLTRYSRLHFLYLTSLSIVFGLTLSIALHPGRWITPYALDLQDPTPPANVSPVEVIYLIYAFSWIADVSSVRT